MPCRVMVQKGVITYVPWLTEGLLRWMGVPLTDVKPGRLN